MDLMIDLETFGTGPKAVIASIGAVCFNYKVGTNYNTKNEQFYKIIDARSQPNRSFDPDTIYFWMNQTYEARKAIIPKFEEERKPNYTELVSLEQALGNLQTFCKDHKIEKIWCYGATFDHIILMDAYKELGLSFPVSYRDLLDMRTFVYIMPKVERPEMGINHNALDDASRQAVWMQRIWQNFIIKCKQAGISGTGSLY